MEFNVSDIKRYGLKELSVSDIKTGPMNKADAKDQAIALIEAAEVLLREVDDELNEELSNIINDVSP